MKFSSNQNSSRYWLYLIGIAATFLPVLLIERSVLQHTLGQFIYPVDDTFIHMEVATNLAGHGTWGINTQEFGSASSSLLYTLILAGCFKIFGTSILIPFIVNCIAAILLVILAANWLTSQLIKTRAAILILLLGIFLMPLPVMIISGMEHTLQTFFSFLFLFGLLRWEQEWVNSKDVKFPYLLGLWAVLLVATRYEGLFLVGTGCLYLLIKKHYRTGFIIGLLSLLPVVIFGLISVSKGSYFLPNSVLIKADEVPLFGGGIANFVQTLFVEKLTLDKPGITAQATQRLLIILPLCYFFLQRRLKTRAAIHPAFAILSLTVLLHLCFASTGKFYRYESYLMFCSGIAIGQAICEKLSFPALKKNLLSVAMISLLGFALCFPLLLRSSAALSKTRQACFNIYEQQFQMAQFLSEHYPNTSFAANDIGAVSFYTKGTVVDLWGLGSNAIARSRKNGYWNDDFLDSTTRHAGARLAIIYDSWFKNTLGNKWTKLASWQIQNNVVCGDDIVSFYAINTADSAAIKTGLRSYQMKLPPTVNVTYY